MPELPGCASQGETLDELEANVREAIVACMHAQLEDADPAVERPSRRWDIAIDEAELLSA